MKMIPVTILIRLKRTLRETALKITLTNDTTNMEEFKQHFRISKEQFENRKMFNIRNIT